MPPTLGHHVTLCVGRCGLPRGAESGAERIALARTRAGPPRMRRHGSAIAVAAASRRGVQRRREEDSRGYDAP